MRKRCIENPFLVLVHFFMKTDIDEEYSGLLFIDKIKDESLLVRYAARPETLQDPAQHMRLERRVKRVIRKQDDLLGELCF